MTGDEREARTAVRRGTAVHEAGHAIVIWALGLMVGSIEIGVNGDDSKGKADLLTSDEHLPLIDRVAICYAGIEAQYVFDSPPHELAGALDHDKVAELLGDMPEPGAKQVREAGFDRARDLLLLHKAKVLRLAERLVTDGKVADFAIFIANNN